jgi:hypothetical protein
VKPEQSGVKPPHSKSIPQSFLQFIKSFDDFFLHQVLTLGHNWFPGDDHFAYGCARRREDDCRQKVFIRRAGNRWVVKIDSEEIRWSTGCQFSPWRADAACAIDSGAVE